MFYIKFKKNIKNLYNKNNYLLSHLHSNSAKTCKEELKYL